jgi:methylglyoxal synthase
MRLLKFIVLLVIFMKMGTATVNAQIDTLFWFAAPWVTPDHDNNVQLAFRISTFGAPANVRIQLPTGTYDTTFVVPANSLASIPLNHIVDDPLMRF